jgi:hypothetical protein
MTQDSRTPDPSVDVGDSARLAALIAEAAGLLWSGDAGRSLALLKQATTLRVAKQDRYALGEAMLRASGCATGWDLYDLHPSRPVDRLPDTQRWDGQACPLLVLVAEQGFGDAIQFLRFVPSVAGRAEKVVFAVHDELLATVRTSPLLADVEVIGKSAARAMHWPAYARWERLMSLPAKIDGLRAGQAEAYLLGPSGRPESTLHATSGVTVGVAWRSTVRHGFPSRSFPARLVRRLTAIPGARVVALHRDRDVKAVPPGVQTVAIDNFVDTAHVISQCDYVVTADTVTAHLAPALGVPTLLCLRHRPDWRWGAPATPIPWYAATRTLYQPPAQSWGPVLDEAATHITLNATVRSTKGRP